MRATTRGFAFLSTLSLLATLACLPQAHAGIRGGRVSCGNVVGIVRTIGQQSNARHFLFLQNAGREAAFRGTTTRRYLDGGSGPAYWAAFSDSLTYGDGVCIPR